MKKFHFFPTSKKWPLALHTIIFFFTYRGQKRKWFKLPWGEKDIVIDDPKI